MKPKADSSGLSRMLLILYSKFCAATSGLIRFLPCSSMALISPHAPPHMGSRSKAFHRSYTLLRPGRVPASISTQMFGCSTSPKAWKNQRCELIFFWFFSFKQNSTCTGVVPFLTCTTPLRISSVICVVYS